MKIAKKTNLQLVKEIEELKRRITELESSHPPCPSIEQTIERTHDISDTKIEVIKEIFQYAEDAVCLISRDFRILWANQMFLEQTRNNAEDVLGKFCHQVTHNLRSPCQPPEDPCPIEKFMKTGKPASLNHVHYDKDGNKIFVDVMVYPVKNEEGETDKFVHLARDVTLSMKVDEIIQSREINLRNVIEKYADGIIIVDKNGAVSFVNSAVEKLFGRKAEEFYGKEFGFPLVEGESTEINIIRSDGEMHTAEMRLVEIDWEGKTAYLASIHDITELKRVEQLTCEMREREELDKAKDEFVSTASHELRTPLTSIKNSVDLILKGKTGTINEAQEKFLLMAERNIKKLNSLIEDLLSLSKIESGRISLRYEEFELRPCIENVISMLKPLADEKHATFKIDIADNLPTVYADVSKIEEVLINLINNAIKFSPDKSTIAIEARHERNEQEIPADTEKHVVIMIKDNGFGIPREAVGHIFNKFYRVETSLSQRQIPGTGLGLPICKGIVEAHNGNIWCESEEAKGSSFIFTIPVVDSGKKYQAALQSKITLARQQHEILSILMLRINGFENFVKKHGEAEGRKIMETFRERIARGGIQKKDEISVFPSNGEIVIVMPDTGTVGAEALRKRIEGIYLNSEDISDQKIRHNYSFSFCIASFPDNGTTAAELLDYARKHITS